MHEHLREVREICEERLLQTQDTKTRTVEFTDVEGYLEIRKYAAFRPGIQNEAFYDDQLVMTCVDIPVTQGLKIRKILKLNEDVNITQGMFFYLPANAIVPCHKDDGMYPGLPEHVRMLNFNVSSPEAMLYVNQSGEEACVEFGVTGYFSTVLRPTQIFHGVINGPEPLIIVQFPIQ